VNLATVTRDIVGLPFPAIRVVTPGCQIGYMDPIMTAINWCFEWKIT
jgi:hypothetical protein